MNSANSIRTETCQWQDKKHLLSAIREQVFIKEQHVPIELEWDGEDETAFHLLAYIADNPVGTARLLPSGQIGRMSVLKPYRELGVGTALLKAAENLAKSNAITSVFLHSQSYIQHFYLSNGYEASGSEW